MCFLITLVSVQSIVKSSFRFERGGCVRPIGLMKHQCIDVSEGGSQQD